ncbi:MAG: hypothetical protein IKX54_01745 [Lachnospiraceae bacterium]|nr:hypothetical protein [Lachnospiraceae bacterium]
MKKITKIIIISVVAVVAAAAVFLLYLNGAFNRFFPKDVTSVTSPDGKYVLCFQQLGDPGWPFGPADVRLVLKDKNGKELNRKEAVIYDDGASASEYNLKTVEWRDDSVIVVLRASEMEDKTVTLQYKKLEGHHGKNKCKAKQ